MTFAVCSDGDLMEGISHEAAELAGHLGLGKLTWIWDDNHITIEGDTALARSADQALRFQAYGWHVIHVHDGNDLEAMDLALEEAKRETERPSLIVLRTEIAYGSPNKVGTAGAHGSPLGREEIEATKKNLGYPSLDPFWVDEGAREHWRACVRKGERLQEAWNARYQVYRAEHPDAAEEFERANTGQLPTDWAADVPDLTHPEKADATRNWSGKVLQGLAKRVPNLVGGSADLEPSNKTGIKGAGDLEAATPGGRVMHFGIREHAMGAVMNGMALHGGVRPFGGTFLIFSDYMRPAIRLAALMRQRVTYVFTHDSIGLGEDGPTHQPIEQLAALRAVPGLCDIRPGDAAETAVAWQVALEREGGPTFLALSRQSVPVLDREVLASADDLRRGGYVLAEASGDAPRAILIASGTELSLALEARETLEAGGVPTRVVSLPSWRLFAEQSVAYRHRVLPPAVTARVSVEASSTFGWERWIGSQGRAIGLDRFGASAPAEVLYAKFGITTDAVVEAVRALLD